MLAALSGVSFSQGRDLAHPWSRFGSGFLQARIVPFLGAFGSRPGMGRRLLRTGGGGEVRRGWASASRAGSRSGPGQGCPYWALSVATVRGSVGGRPPLQPAVVPAGRVLRRAGAGLRRRWASTAALRATSPRLGSLPARSPDVLARRGAVSPRSARHPASSVVPGTGCRASGLEVTCWRSGTAAPG